jgi:hypothetical protein
MHLHVNYFLRIIKYTLGIILIVHTILRLMMLVDLAIIMKRRLFLYHNSNQSGRIFPRQEITHD